MYRRHVRARCRLYAQYVRRFVVHDVLHADDPPHRLALGAAIGVFVTFTPTIGLQMILVVFLSWLLGANKIVGLPVVWLSNPATFVPMYYSCYVIGRSVLGRPEVGDAWWSRLSDPPDHWWPTVTFYWSHLLEIASPLWVGCIMVGFLLAYFTYYVVHQSIVTYRARRPLSLRGT
jgi:uncharacterized protein (DUF2062 family)